MAEIRIVDLSFGFGGRLLLDRISLVIPDGAVFLLMGPSGCGKTTLLGLIAGFLRPMRGEIYLDDRLVSSPRTATPPRDRAVGMVFQSLALWPHLSARQHVRFAARERGRVDELLAAVGLADAARRRPDALSGGQKQRLAILRAVASDPRILLLDEPFSNLDPPFRLEVTRLLRALWERSRHTVCLVTHDPREVMLPVTGAVLLEGGRVYGPRPVEELLELRGSPYASLLREYLDATSGAGRH